MTRAYAAKPRRGPNGGTSNPLKSRIWRERIIPGILRRDCGICHACRACGCPGTSADSVDHDPVPLIECEAAGISPFDASNLKAIHGKPCPFCHIRCNTVKRDSSMATFRLKWQKKTGKQAPAAGVEPEVILEGREW